MKYPINEIFETIQGEGSWSGTPSIFIRLQGCPVGCPWCDTKHTWVMNTEHEIDQDAIIFKTTNASTYAMFSVADIMHYVSNAASKHIVLTGGEPALYDLFPLSYCLIDRGYTVQIETSATTPLMIDKSVFVTASPKVNMPGGYSISLDVIRRADEIKFPIGKRAHVEAFEKLLADCGPLNRKPLIYLQPLSQSKTATKECIELARLNNWRVSFQVHKYVGLR